MKSTTNIFIIMGKSSSGKDTIFRRLRARPDLALRAIVPYTTRPIRDSDESGSGYYFTDEAAYQGLLAAGRIIESRAYHTYHGLWRYFTVCDEQFDFAEDASDRLMIGTLESCLRLREHFAVADKDMAKVAVVPILIELDDGLRLARALERERSQEIPRYEEMCRRFLADAEDFSEEMMAEAGVARRFDNSSLDECEAAIAEYIQVPRWT